MSQVSVSMWSSRLLLRTSDFFKSGFIYLIFEKKYNRYSSNSAIMQLNMDKALIKMQDII